MQYTQCKIVGNGSFGVVFQTKLAPNGEDAAIKRVLQDKRFKVCSVDRRCSPSEMLMVAESGATDHADCPPSQHCGAESILLLKRRTGKQAYFARWFQ